MLYFRETYEDYREVAQAVIWPGLTWLLDEWNLGPCKWKLLIIYCTGCQEGAGQLVSIIPVDKLILKDTLLEESHPATLAILYLSTI